MGWTIAVFVELTARLWLDAKEVAGRPTEDEKVVTGREAAGTGKEDGVRSLSKLVDPFQAQQCGMEEHNLFHALHRNGCPICVKARGKALDHQKKFVFK